MAFSNGTNGGGGFTRRRPQPSAGGDGPTIPGRRPARGSRFWWIAGIVVLAVFILPSIFAEYVTDWLWFGSQGLSSVYATRLWLGLGVFVVGGLFAGLFCWANWRIAWRIARPEIVYQGQRDPLSPGLVRGLMLGGAIVVALVLGLTASGRWTTILLYLNRVPFGQADPLFNNDIGFYLFSLPFYRFLRNWALVLLVAGAIGAGIIYIASLLPQLNGQFSAPLQSRGPRSMRPRLNISKGLETHLSTLGALFLLLVAFGYWLSTFDLLYSSRAVAYGAGYTDTQAKLPSLYIMMVVAVVTAALLIVNTRVRAWKLLVGALGLWLVALILVGGVYPAVVQEFVVKPNEISLEKPYITNNINLTRLAFGLDKFEEREVPAVESITQAQVADNQNTIQNIRLWDYRPLLATYSQLQEIRSYYSFDSVDIDRYSLGGKTRQVMLSARELSVNNLSGQTGDWQNRHFVYTHGYGAVMSPVHEIEGEGLPKLLVKNIPPETEFSELKMTRPEIYYGEQTDDYVFVNSSTQEFDYPLGNNNKYTTYAGKGGVNIGNFFTKLLFSVRFGDTKLMLSNAIKPETRILFHRNIYDTVRLLAPFLTYDHDPYVVIADGKLYWIQDAYTTSTRFPYSTPYEDSYNYIRNSVKVVIDAYNGTPTFYVADSADPIIKAYRGIFPVLFHDIAEMPASLRSHLRYPEGLMNAQARMFAAFHVTDPQVFYTKEDVWNVPFGTRTENAVPLEAYYVNMQIPGDTKEIFSLILPFTPSGRDNMIAWMAARSDGAEYGKVDVIRYPKQQLVYGPTQIEARIDQDPLISQQITLWNTSGSKVIRGNLLTIPIGDSILYVEPLFLEASGGGSSFPELKRVIVATGNRVGIGSDLNEALLVAFDLAPGQIIGANPTGGTSTVPPTGAGTPTANSTPGTTQPSTTRDLTRSALDHYDRARAALKDGDWTTYGREIDAMKVDLDKLASLEGVNRTSPTTPTPAPTP